MLTITNNLCNCSKNATVRYFSRALLVIVDMIAGAIILSIGIAALYGRVSLPQSVAISMISIGALQLFPFAFQLTAYIGETIFPIDRKTINELLDFKDQLK